MLASALALLLNAAPCEVDEKRWSAVGLKAPCAVFRDARTPKQRLVAAEEAWSLGPDDARCAVLATFATKVDPQRSEWEPCVRLRLDRAPLALWVGWLADGATPRAQELSRRLSANDAIELLAFDAAPHGALARLVVQQHPESLRRVMEVLPLTAQFEFALWVSASRPEIIGPSTWPLIARAVVEAPLRDEALARGAKNFVALPASQQPIAFIQLSKRDQLLLGLGLVLIDRRDAARALQLDAPTTPTESLLSDLLRWHLTGKRTMTPSDAAQRAHDEAVLRSDDGLEVLAPFIAPAR